MQQLYKDFEKLVKRQHDELRKLYLPSQTNCFRIYDRQLQGLPVTVERYGEYLKVESEEEVDLQAVRESASRMTYIPLERTAAVMRAPSKGGASSAQNEPSPGRIPVEEMGISYYADLWTYRDTGLFLDHAVTRDLVRENSLGKRVLNLFCYTGSFTAAAAAGGAQETVSVDLSNTYLDWLQDNLKLNKLQAPVHRIIRGDVLKFLESPPKDIGRFHIIILDPPSFSNSHAMDRTFDVQRDYQWCIRRCMDLLAQQGVLIFSENLRSFKFDRKSFSQFLVQEITRETIPPGFTVKRFPHRCWMIRKRG